MYQVLNEKIKNKDLYNDSLDNLRHTIITSLVKYKKSNDAFKKIGFYVPSNIVDSFIC